MLEAVPVSWIAISDVIEVVSKSLERRWRLTSEDARAAVHEAAIRLIEKQVVAKNLEAVLAVTANHIITDEYRQRLPCCSLPLYEPADESESKASDPAIRASESWEPEVTAIQRELRAIDCKRVQTAMSKVSATDQYILAEYYFKGRRPTDLDREHKGRVGTAKDKLFRARERIRRALVGKQYTV